MNLLRKLPASPFSVRAATEKKRVHLYESEKKKKFQAPEKKGAGGEIIFFWKKK